MEPMAPYEDVIVEAAPVAGTCIYQSQSIDWPL